MNLSLESLNYKITNKFDYVLCIGKYLYDVLNDCINYSQNVKPNDNIKKKAKRKLEAQDYIYTDVDKYELLKLINLISKTVLNVEDAYVNFTSGSSNIFCEYYKIIDANNSSNKVKAKDLLDEFHAFVISENYIDLIDNSFTTFKKSYGKLETNKPFKIWVDLPGNVNPTELKYEIPCLSEVSNKSYNFGELKFKGVSYRNTIKRLLDLFNDAKITLTLKTKDVNYCDCGAKMILHSESSEMHCLLCGCINKLDGTVFEEAQYYNNQGQAVKTKKYDYNKHCIKCVNQIQAKEAINIPSEDIEKIDKKAVQDYTRVGVLRSMENMKCAQVRQWLKSLKLTKYNPHAPLIRKIITSMHGPAATPPQLITEEEELILLDFSKALAVFEEVVEDKEILLRIGKKKIKNKPFYQHILLKILCIKMEEDPRLKKLIECIHFQSSATINKNDIIWRRICVKLNYKYEPTDRTILLD